MIRHIVFFSATDTSRIEEVREGLMMLSKIPHALRFEVGRNLQTDPIAGPVPDLVVYAEFADESALAAFKAHPTYAACTAHVRPMREMRIAADFTSDLPLT
ncbi:Dabb family protein [Pseudohalocynthiibacter aestuariivivens]|uniref:Dabb family protein n=1 Tax=Roseovarius pelagicus TaxID=2980108 RepID=A0ABY6DDK1_9RHOB|nr:MULTISPECIES: Dabb family protein [Rhodobacterales]QIE47315.1 Dabb family protein [Pseudohalocynthiibacter aestuariivivens]UXX84124.1 Dabb family protein [Roseovarius pelagicus]